MYNNAIVLFSYLRAVGVCGRGEGPEEVNTEHGDYLGVDRLG